MIATIPGSTNSPPAMMPPSDPIDGRAGLVLPLVEHVARLAQARQRCPGGVGEPTRRVDEVRKRCAALALQQADDGGLLRWWRAPPAQGRARARLGRGGRRCRRATCATRRLGPRSRRRVCLALCHLSLRAVTAHHAPSLATTPRPAYRQRGWEGSLAAERRPVNTHSNALERAQVQSDLP